MHIDALRCLPALLALLAASCSAPGPRALWDEDAVTWVDLTHAFGEDTVYWPTAPGFEIVVDAKGPAEGGYWYESNTIRTSEHGGTHLDAPVHFAKDAHTTDEVPVEQLIGPACVVDVRAACAENRDYQVRVEDLEAFEAAHGRIDAGSIVLLHTGFGAYWPDAERYLGTAERGYEASLELHFPGLSPRAAKWLVERGIDAIGIDTPSIDHGPSRMFFAHRELYAANIPALENVAHLDQLPPTGAVIFALPMKIRGGSGGPLRVVAAVPR
ncbi:MAG: cyclase family protein [Planctomycetota bacterium]|nr:cyclase family protein [Planctomycetota bacterium]